MRDLHPRVLRNVLVQESQSESNDLEETSKFGLEVRLTWLPVDNVGTCRFPNSLRRISSFVFGYT